MTTCSTLDDLNEKFLLLTSSLKQKITLRDGLGDERCNNVLVAVESGLSDLEVQLTLMRSEIARRKKALAEVESIKQQATILQQQVTHMSENLPQRMPQNKEVKDIKSKLISGIPVTPTFKRKPLMPLTPQSMCSNGSYSPTGTLSTTQIKRKAPTLFVPTIDYITVQEFESVPKYMRGRMNYEQVNTSIDEFNKAVTSKYRLLATPRSKQNDRIRNAIRDYKQIETKDTKGLWFIVDNDLKQFSSLKLDSVGRTILTILRHCNRMKEIRTKGVIRYAVVPL